jgi:hypothetical protein
LALGIVVAATTDVPLAPEAGLLLGVLVSWFLAPAGCVMISVWLCQARAAATRSNS